MMGLTGRNHNEVVNTGVEQSSQWAESRRSEEPPLIF